MRLISLIGVPLIGGLAGLLAVPLAAAELKPQAPNQPRNFVPLTVQCMNDAAAAYRLPTNALLAILHVEGGQVGQAVNNENRTQDLGPFQVNTIWLPVLTRYWRLPSEAHTYNALRDNGCANAWAGAAILGYHFQETKNIYTAIGHYHSRTPERAKDYTFKVMMAALRNSCRTEPGPTPGSDPVCVKVAELSRSQVAARTKAPKAKAKTKAPKVEATQTASAAPPPSPAP